jgi:hypothetical protein
MINEAPLARFRPLAEGLVRPIYADYAFGNIPSTIEHLLTGGTTGALLPPDCFGGSYPRPEKVVLFLVDSLAGSSGSNTTAASAPRPALPMTAP